MSNVTARLVAFAAVVAACSHAPCMKLGHAWSPPSELESITTDPKPRCAASDPTCGPEPYDSERACYDPAARRVPLSEPNGGRSARERCVHDGECIVVSACRACEHYSVAASVECEKKDGAFDEGALCGCLDGWCRAFRN